jgi:hypothetical protein
MQPAILRSSESNLAPDAFLLADGFGNRLLKPSMIELVVPSMTADAVLRSRICQLLVNRLGSLTDPVSENPKTPKVRLDAV